MGFINQLGGATLYWCFARRSGCRPRKKWLCSSVLGTRLFAAWCCQLEGKPWQNGLNLWVRFSGLCCWDGKPLNLGETQDWLEGTSRAQHQPLGFQGNVHRFCGWINFPPNSTYKILIISRCGRMWLDVCWTERQFRSFVWWKPGKTDFNTFPHGIMGTYETIFAGLL